MKRQTPAPERDLKRAATSSLDPGIVGAANPTVYARNLNDQVSIRDLRTTLYMLFSPYGHVVAINAHRSARMRGQAHVAFADVAAASQAIRGLQGQRLFGKPLVLAYARAASHALQRRQAHAAAKIAQP